MYIHAYTSPTFPLKHCCKKHSLVRYCLPGQGDPQRCNPCSSLLPKWSILMRMGAAATTMYITAPTETYIYIHIYIFLYSCVITCICVCIHAFHLNACEHFQCNGTYICSSIGTISQSLLPLPDVKISKLCADQLTELDRCNPHRSIAAVNFGWENA